MLDGMSDSIQRSRIENLHSRDVDRQSPTGLIFSFFNLNYIFLFLFSAVLVGRQEGHLAYKTLGVGLLLVTI